MKKENRAVNSLAPASRRFLAMTATVAASMSRMLFAAGDDLGITAYLDTIRSILMAIGAGLLVLSLGTWAVKAIIKKNIAPEDWKAIGVMAMGGVVLIIAPTLVETIFGSSLGDAGA